MINKGRLAGFFYVLMLPLGAMQSLFRSSAHCAYAIDLLVVACYVVVTALLYEVFQPVSSATSLTAAFFSLVGCAVQAVAALFRIAPPADAALKLLYAPTYRIAVVFFGFYLLLIGSLIFKSTFMPRLLGILVIISGLGWMTFLWPPLGTALWPRWILTLAIGEGCLMFWLLIMGVKQPAR